MKLSEGWLNVLRCSLYFWTSVLTPVGVVIHSYAVNQSWPDNVEILDAGVTGLIAGLIAVRAYVDGSNERWRQSQVEKT